MAYWELLEGSFGPLGPSRGPLGGLLGAREGPVEGLGAVLGATVSQSSPEEARLNHLGDVWAGLGAVLGF